MSVVTFRLGRHTATLRAAACERNTIAKAQSRQITVECLVGRPRCGTAAVSTSAMTMRECARVTRPQSGQGS